MRYTIALGAKYCDEYVRLFVCSVHSRNSKTKQLNFTNFLCMLPLAVAQSFSVIAMRYVLSVLWMTTCFHVMALWRVMYVRKRR